MKTRYLLAFALAIVAGVIVLASESRQAVGAPPGAGASALDFVDGQVIVKFKPGTPAALQAAAHSQAGGQTVDAIPALGVQLVEVGPGRVDAALAGYSRNPNVEYAEANRIFHATVDCPAGGSTDPCFERQWGLDNTAQDYGKGAPGTADVDVDAPEAWATANTGGGIVVAVLDTGIDTSHPNFAGKVDCSVGGQCADFTGAGIQDLHGHGTWTASLVASSRDGIGIAGAAPDAGLLIGKVLDNTGSGSLFEIADGVVWATQQGADVISMSLGGSCPRAPVFGCRTLETAVNDAWAAGVLLLAAAGNGGSNSTEYPGAFANVIAVAAIDADNQLASFTDPGEIAAPGVNVFGAFPHCGGSAFALQNDPYFKDCDYDYGNGTSASTPLAAGVAAVVWSGSPALSNADVRAALQQSTDPVTGSKDGYGRVNACRALNSTGVTCAAGGSGPTATPTPSVTEEPAPTATPCPPGQKRKGNC